MPGIGGAVVDAVSDMGAPIACVQGGAGVPIPLPPDVYLCTIERDVTRTKKAYIAEMLALLGVKTPDLKGHP